jgi:hypothetical protein
MNLIKMTDKLIKVLMITYNVFKAYSIEQLS